MLHTWFIGFAWLYILNLNRAVCFTSCIWCVVVQKVSHRSEMACCVHTLASLYVRCSRCPVRAYSATAGIRSFGYRYAVPCARHASCGYGPAHGIPCASRGGGRSGCGLLSVAFFRPGPHQFCGDGRDGRGHGRVGASTAPSRRGLVPRDRPNSHVGAFPSPLLSPNSQVGSFPFTFYLPLDMCIRQPGQYRYMYRCYCGCLMYSRCCSVCAPLVSAIALTFILMVSALALTFYH